MLQYILGRCLFILLLLLFLIGLMKVFHVLASFSPGDWGSKGAPVLPSVGMDREHRPLPGESTGWERSRDATPKGAKDKRWVEYKAVFQNINRVHCHCCRTMMICTRRASRETQDWTSWSTRLVSYWPVRQDTNQRTGIAIRAILGGIRVMLHACVTNLSKLASLVQDVTIHIQESHLLVMYTPIREIGPLHLSLHCCKHAHFGSPGSPGSRGVAQGDHSHGSVATFSFRLCQPEGLFCRHPLCRTVTWTRATHVVWGLHCTLGWHLTTQRFLYLSEEVYVKTLITLTISDLAKPPPWAVTWPEWRGSRVLTPTTASGADVPGWVA